MPTNVVMTKLRDRVREYSTRVKISEIDGDKPMSIVRAPVNYGPSQFIDVTDLTSLHDLPHIPERMRDFAFRYATEYMSREKWAVAYNCSRTTIDNWLQRPGVKAYIAACRYEQRTYNLAHRINMQKTVYRTMDRIMNHKITGDTIGPMVNLVKFVYDVLHNPDAANNRAKGAAFNVNIGVGSESYGGVDNPHRFPERDVTPKQIAELESDIEELEILALALAKNKAEISDE